MMKRTKADNKPRKKVAGQSANRFDFKKKTIDKPPFPYDDSKPRMVHVYTNSISLGKKPDKRVGFAVYFGVGDSRNVKDRYDGPQESLRGELHSVIRALQLINDSDMNKSVVAVVVHTPSDFVKNKCGRLMNQWRRERGHNDLTQPSGKHANLYCQMRTLIELERVFFPYLYYAQTNPFGASIEENMVEDMAREGAMMELDTELCSDDDCTDEYLEE